MKIILFHLVFLLGYQLAAQTPLHLISQSPKCLLWIESEIAIKRQEQLESILKNSYDIKRVEDGDRAVAFHGEYILKINNRLEDAQTCEVNYQVLAGNSFDTESQFLNVKAPVVKKYLRTKDNCELKLIADIKKNIRFCFTEKRDFKSHLNTDLFEKRVYDIYELALLPKRKFLDIRDFYLNSTIGINQERLVRLKSLRASLQNLDYKTYSQSTNTDFVDLIYFLGQLSK